MRIGHGFDVHRFDDSNEAFNGLSEKARITLGGVLIPSSRPLLAHSDGDVLIHAVCDALLGAAAMGDIGHHFPDTDSRYKGIDSRKLLRHVVLLLMDRGFSVINVDSTIVAQAPKMAPYIEAMCQNLANDLTIARDAVNIKATTTEKLGYAGRKEGIAVHAVTLLDNG
ncbi:2-C-methyl-D-erythritol 2,4-cyclodiphosphate synthase [invertebrate metagenome]|uniref:2-C-methyl-D-erythritol 2,4-cyclodiphosphate synthase n=1 Tax=invertebrate metagenome TaxID=1711999 RepID=A0A2H9T986_9ZZZZ